MDTKDTQHQDSGDNISMFDINPTFEALKSLKDFLFDTGYNAEALAEAQHLASNQMESDLDIARRELRREIEKCKSILRKERPWILRRQVIFAIMKHPLAYLYGKYKLKHNA